MDVRAEQPVISVRGLVVGFGEQRVLDGLSLDVRAGEILGVVGGSGAGKSVLLRTIIGLIPKRSGTIRVFGVSADEVGERKWRAIERRWGILFQQGALFSSLTPRLRRRRQVSRGAVRRHDQARRPRPCSRP
jgi:phospholipid/cholesterol/gamma-HCH transport system ATP-binding protein